MSSRQRRASDRQGGLGPSQLTVPDCVDAVNEMDVLVRTPEKLAECMDQIIRG